MGLLGAACTPCQAAAGVPPVPPALHLHSTSIAHKCSVHGDCRPPCSWTGYLAERLSLSLRSRGDGDKRRLGTTRRARFPAPQSQQVVWTSGASQGGRSPSSPSSKRRLEGGLSAASSGLVRTESYYVADLLTPDGQIKPQQPVTRKLLTSQKEFGLKPRDVATLLARSSRLGFDMNVRDGAVVITLGGDGPSYVVGTKSTWIFHRVVASPVSSKQLTTDENDQGAHDPSDLDLHHSGHKEHDHVLKGLLVKILRKNGNPQPELHDEQPVHPITSQRLQRRFLEVEGGGRSSDVSEMLGLAPLLEDKAMTKVNPSNLNVPFTLAVAEAALSVFVEKLESSMRKQAAVSRHLISTVDRIVLTMGADSKALDLDQIRVLKQRLGRIDSVSNSLKQTLFQILGDEDDMQSLANKVCERGQCSEEDWELCFEFYLQKAEEIQAEAQRTIEDLEDLESLIGLSISRRRLELEEMSLWLEIMAAGIGVGGVLTGALGMNLLSGLEEKRYGFHVASIFVAAVSTGVCWALRVLVHRRLRQRRPKNGLVSRRPVEALVSSAV